MSDERDTGGSAFPQPDWVNPQNGKLVHFHGMTLRDYFAGQALSARYAMTAAVDPIGVGRIAYGIADAMLEARK